MHLAQNFRPFGMPKLTKHSACGEFLTALMNVVLQRPQYLSAADCPRYASLIQEFLECRTHIGQQTALVAKVPLDDLYFALKQWITQASHNTEAHPLMSSYVLDTAQLIVAHAYGERRYSQPPWTLEPMLDFCEDSHRQLIDPHSKGDITGGINGLLVRVHVPEGAAYRPRNPQLNVTMAGPCELHALLERCHLSEAFHDFVDFKLEGAARPTFDLMDDFQFSAELVSIDELPSTQPVSLYAGGTYRRPRVKVPGGWITASYNYASKCWQLVPSWSGQKVLGTPNEVPHV
jgi:hypothetical protein